MNAARNIARTMGVGVNDRIDLSDPDQMQRFARGIVTQEHGPSSRRYTDDIIRRGISGGTGGPGPRAKPLARWKPRAQSTSTFMTA